MEVSQLKYFLVVARTEHMTQAAELLHISQPSLSNSISRLEQSLGHSLFDREEGKGIKLNEFGRIFTRRASRAITELEDSVREMNELAFGNEHRIHISISIPDLLSDLLNTYLEAYPNDFIHQVFQSNHQMLEGLYQKEIDMAISWIPPTGIDIKWIPLIDDEIFLLVSSDSWLAAHQSVPLNLLENEKFIINTSTLGFQETTDALCMKSGFKPNVIFQGTDSQAVGELVSKNQGITFIPAHSLKKTEKMMAKPMKAVKIDSPYARHTIGIATLKDHYLTVSAMRFYNHTVELLREMDSKLNFRSHRKC